MAPMQEERNANPGGFRTVLHRLGPVAFRARCTMVRFGLQHEKVTVRRDFSCPRRADAAYVSDWAPVAAIMELIA
jgi:hypothetical protein